MTASSSRFLRGDPAHCGKIARVLQDTGLEATVVNIIPGPEHSPISPLAAHRRAAADHLK